MRLHIRLTLLIVVLAAVTGGTLALLVSEVMHNALEQEMEKRGVVIAQTMAEHVTHNVIDGEVVTAREALQEIIQRTEDVEFAYIVGFDGEVFAHSFEDGFPRALLPDKHDLIRGDTLHLERYSTQEGLGLLVGYPLIDGMKAHLHVGLNETYLHDQVESTRNQIVSVTLMVALVTALIGILLSRSIARPLEQLSESLRTFGEGRVEQALDYRGGGREVADLTRSFNHMIAERVRAEEALRLERDNLINILEAMEDGVYIVNQQYDIQYVNPVLQGDFGPFEGRKCYAYFHDREEVCPWCKNRDVFAGKTVQWEWYSSKNQRTYDLIDTPLRNADGSMSKLEIFRDITERKRAEETLRVSARQWQTTFDAISDSVCLIDLEGTILRSNEGTAKLLGKPLDEIIGATCWELVHGTSEPIAGCPIVRMQSSRRRETLALPVGDRWLNVTVDPLLDEEGSLIGGVHVIADITERVRAEEALREHREHLEAMVAERTAELRESEEKSRAQYQGIPVPTYTWQRVGEDLVLVDYNAAALEITQGGVANFVGKKATEMYRDMPDIRDEIERCLAEKTTIEREMPYHYTTTTGESKHLAVKYAFVPPDLVLVHTEDITERVRAEEEIKKRSAELKQLVDLMAGREIRMAELKEVIRQLRAQLVQAGMTAVADDPLLAGGRKNGE